MIRVERRVPIRTGADDAFGYLADFSNLPKWDPGIATATRSDEGPLAAGARFRVVAQFFGRKVPMDYVMERFDVGTRTAVLVGTADGIRATDRITVEPRGAGALVHWHADFELLGAQRFLSPLMRPLFSRLADKAMAGLAEKLG